MGCRSCRSRCRAIARWRSSRDLISPHRSPILSARSCSCSRARRIGARRSGRWVPRERAIWERRASSSSATCCRSSTAALVRFSTPAARGSLRWTRGRAASQRLRRCQAGSLWARTRTAPGSRGGISPLLSPCVSRPSMRFAWSGPTALARTCSRCPSVRRPASGTKHLRPPSTRIDPISEGMGTSIIRIYPID